MIFRRIAAVLFTCLIALASSNAAFLVIRAPPSNIAIIRSILGPSTVTSPSQITGLGTIATNWYNQCIYNLNARWVFDGGDWTGVPVHAGDAQGSNGGDYYSRDAGLYQLYAITGDITYKTRADAYVLDIANFYFYGTGGIYGSFYLQWVNPRALYIYDAVNGGIVAPNAAGAGGSFGVTLLGLLADGVATGGFGTEIHAGPRGVSPDMDTRQLARAIELLVFAVKSGTQTATNNAAAFSTFLATRLTDSLTLWLDPDGGVRNSTEKFHNKAFMAGILLQAWATYERVIGPDARIPAARKLAVDYLINNHWQAQYGGFSYDDGQVPPSEIDNDGPTPAKLDGTVPIRELNQFIVGPLWQVAHDQGETSPSGFYTAIGDRAFVESMNYNSPINAGLYSNYPITSAGGKQTNEECIQSFRFFDDRLAVSASALPDTTLNVTTLDPTTLFPISPGQMINEGASGDTSDYGATAWRWNTATASTLKLTLVKPWPNGQTVSIEVRVKKPASGGISCNPYISLDNDGAPAIVTLSPTPLVGTLSTSAWTTIGAYAVVNAAQGTTSLGRQNIIINASDGVTPCSGTLDIDSVYFGLGGSGQYFGTPKVPILDYYNVLQPDPVTTGTPGVGNVFTLTNGTYLNGTTSFVYKWYRDGLIIGGATSKTYTQVSADSGHWVWGSEQASNGVGAGTWIQSPSIAVP